jgi:hypothetical protein
MTLGGSEYPKHDKRGKTKLHAFILIEIPGAMFFALPCGEAAAPKIAQGEALAWPWVDRYQAI